MSKILSWYSGAIPMPLSSIATIHSPDPRFTDKRTIGRVPLLYLTALSMR